MQMQLYVHGTALWDCWILRLEHKHTLALAPGSMHTIHHLLVLIQLVRRHVGSNAMLVAELDSRSQIVHCPVQGPYDLEITKDEVVVCQLDVLRLGYENDETVPSCDVHGVSLG